MIALLIAPAGFGKTTHLNRLQQKDPNAVWLKAVDLPLAQFLSHTYQQLGPLLKTPSQPESTLAWLECLNQAPAMHLLLDNWERMQPAVQHFWRALIADWPSQHQLTLAARTIPDLNLGAAIQQAQFQIMGTQELALSPETAQNMLGHWEARDQAFFDSCQGWPLGWSLYVALHQQKLSEPHFKQQLQSAIDEVLLSYQEPPFDGGWASETWLQTLTTLPPLWRQSVWAQNKVAPAHWFHRALQVKDLEQRRLFLQRAYQLEPNAHGPLSLSILTRWSHAASLLGEWDDVERALNEAKTYLDQGHNSDRAAYHYLKANRLRQRCEYEAVEDELRALLHMQSRDMVVLDFQSRAHIVRGLAAYQQGQLSQTKSSYQAALHLAQSDGNTAMVLEITIMLAYLAALQGDEVALDDDIEEQIENQPLSAQTLMWLNLAFLWLLGEDLDLNKGQYLLKKATQTAQTLGWAFLEPLIDDISARLHRFHDHHALALEKHTKALKVLPKGTFEYYHAQLNHALTLLKTKQEENAQQLLTEVIEACESNHSTLLLKEARLALERIQPQTSTPLYISTENAKAPLRIQMFGGLEVYLKQEKVTRWPRKKARHLLIYLLLHPRGTHRETLAEWLSGQEDPEQALRQLDVHVHSLRKVLEPERKGKTRSQYVRFESAAYHFNWEASYYWDVQVFEQGYQSWLQHKKTSPQAMRACQQALDAYQGPFLPELDFADFWWAERESYRRKSAELLIWNAHILAQDEDFSLAESTLERLFQEEPTHPEGAKALLDIAFAQKSQHALKQSFSRIEDLFMDTLELPPDPEIEAHFQTLLKQL